MLHLVFCISVWTFLFSLLVWRFTAIAKQAVRHLKRLHQIPCNKCAYFTGDYRLKCTVNPTTAMSETAIGCRDFLYNDCDRVCRRDRAFQQCDRTPQKSKLFRFQRKLTYLK